VPAGDFVYGSRDPDELRRTFFLTEPERVASTGAYFIARHEVTWADWLAYLEALGADEREARRPKADDVRVTREPAGGPWRLHIVPGGEGALTAPAGTPITLPARDRRREQRWERWPVTGITPEDAEAYAAWLASTGRLPGARLCREHEWERAARGADERLFPGGDTLAPDDANIDVTYGRQSLAFGPDEVGSHPASTSPFGVEDLAGNVWEYVRAGDGSFAIRGGGYFEGQSSARATNRDAAAPGMRDRVIGFRICADAR
jgi:formylglycine-generating enzyme required for sulfatase activity